MKIRALSLLVFIPFLFLFFVYLHNLSGDIYGGDVGDLVTAGFVMGVPHPPGYPLFTILVFLFSKLPISESIAFKAGLISVISSTASLIAYFLYARRISKSVLVAFTATFILAFSYLFWFYAEIAEVFSLNSLFIVLLLFLAIVFYKSKNTKVLFALSFLSGLALTNHHTILLIFPSIALLVFSHFKIFLKNKLLLLRAALLFLLGLVPYIYIPFAASKSPVINWDNAVTVENFLHLVLRKGYGTFSPGSFTPAIPEERVLILKQFIEVTVSSLTLPVIVITLIGVLYLLKKKKFILLSSLLLAYLLVGPLFTIYAGFPLVNAFVIGVAERFYIAPTIILMFIFPYGMKAIYTFFNSFFSKKIFATIVMSVFLIIPLLLFRYNYQRTDLSETTIGSDFGKDILRFMPANAVFFVNGDTAVFNTWYVHYVEKVRPDITVIRVGDFKVNEFTLPYRLDYKNQNIKEDEYEWVSKEIMKKHRVFYSNQSKLTDKNLSFLQYGLVAELINKELPSKEQYEKDVQEIWSNIDMPIKDKLPIYERNLTASHIASYYADSLSQTGNNLYYKYGNKDLAREYLLKALEGDKRIARTYASLALLLSSGFKECSEAEKYVMNAISLNPLATEYQVILYDVYANCFKDSKKVEGFKKQYKSVYGKDFTIKEPAEVVQ